MSQSRDLRVSRRSLLGAGGGLAALAAFGGTRILIGAGSASAQDAVQLTI